MIRLKLSEIANIVNARVQGADVTIDTVSTDSRTLSGAALFIALKGAKFDGNRFLAEVAEKGAVALICTEVPPASVAIP